MLSTHVTCPPAQAGVMSPPGRCSGHGRRQARPPDTWRSAPEGASPSINTCGDSGPRRRCLWRRKAQNEGRYDQSNNHEKRQHIPLRRILSARRDFLGERVNCAGRARRPDQPADDEQEHDAHANERNESVRRQASSWWDLGLRRYPRVELPGPRRWSDPRPARRIAVVSTWLAPRAGIERK